MKKISKQKQNIIIATVIIILAFFLAAMIYMDIIDEAENTKHYSEISIQEQEELNKKKSDLSMQILTGTTWQDNDLKIGGEVVLDTEDLIDKVFTTSAMNNDARLSWNLSKYAFDEKCAYYWRFALATVENRKTVYISNGVTSDAYTIWKDYTLFIVPVEGRNLNLTILLDGGEDEFEPTYIYDIQLVKIENTEEVGTDIIAGQYDNAEHTQNMFKNIDLEGFVSKLSSGNYTSQQVSEIITTSENAKIVNGKAQIEITYNLNSFVGENIVLIEFTACTNTKAGMLNVFIDGTEYTADRYMTTQNQEYIFPIYEAGIFNKVNITATVDFEDFVRMGNFGIFMTSISDSKQIAGGTYLVDSYDKVTISSEEHIIDSATAGISDGSYLYTVTSGVLKIYSLEDNENPIIVSELDGIGDVREIKFINNGKGVAITARENGVWFVDISDVTNPFIVSHYDTLELATGLAVCGNYVVVCSRYWGAEIIDISDVKNPKYCSSVSNRKEYYDCAIEDNYLYISAWAQKCVEIYDLSDVYNPKFICTVSLDGNGGGITVQDGIMYVSTGYNGQGDSSDEFSAAYGNGNGLEIYDVSIPAETEWMSSCKIDGRYWISGFDHWKIAVSGSKAYFSSVSNGVYIFDISDPYAPLRETHIAVNIPATSANYKALGNIRILPDGSDGKGKEIIADVVPVQGYVYLLGTLDGTYIYADANTKNEQQKAGDWNGTKRIIDKVNSSKYDTCQYTADSAIYAASTGIDGKIYAAAGRSGILVFNINLELLYTIETVGETKDILIKDDYIYSAEGEKGFTIYQISDYGAKQIGRLATETIGETWSTLEWCGDKEYIIAQCGFTNVKVIDISDPTNPTEASNYRMGSMYSRNLCAGVVKNEGSYLTGVFSSGIIKWFNQYGEEESSMANALTGESDGAAAVGESVLALKDQGYVCYNPFEAAEETLNSLSVIKVDGTILRGKPVVKDNLMVVSYGYGHTIFLVDISDLNNPKLIESIEINGNPDIAEIADEYILVPLRNDGLLMLKMRG